uniref:Olfactory receptor n=1 Tax=Geotrypetes seraphini TaxID=260995 RepID=A0A6P8SPS0_GEOSA|nr:olfactory receptor 13C9-like [Geotrypetes seraphini]
MESENQTKVTEFVLLGLTDRPDIALILFLVVLLLYLVILSTNALIIIVICMNPNLHVPMYFFLCNLSSLDICYTSSSIPRMLKDIISEKKTISFGGCVVQMYISLSFGVVECILLMVMACDRYIAICYPLSYTSIMNKLVCVKLAVGTWITGFMISMIPMVWVLTLPFCGYNRVNHFMCEFITMVRLACIDIYPIELLIFVSGLLLLISPISVIIFTYIYIIVNIMKIQSADGRRKAFSTCSSHLTVVILFYGTGIGVYMKPRSLMSEKDKIISLVYFVFTPMLNPLIYTLRNSDVVGALRKTIRGN